MCMICITYICIGEYSIEGVNFIELASISLPYQLQLFDLSTYFDLSYAYIFVYTYTIIYVYIFVYKFTTIYIIHVYTNFTFKIFTYICTLTYVNIRFTYVYCICISTYSGGYRILLRGGQILGQPLFFCNIKPKKGYF